MSISATDLEKDFPIGTILTMVGRLPEPVRLEAIPALSGSNFLILKVVEVANPNTTYKQVVLNLTEFMEKVKVISRPGQRNLDANADHFRLAIEAERLRLAYAYDPHFAVSISAIDALPHQIDAVYHHMLKMSRVKFLLADDPGAGKTIMAGLLLKELKIRKVVKRTLIVTPAALTGQWQAEMSQKFSEQFKIVSRGTVGDNPGLNIWQENDQIITSIDFAKQDEIFEALERSEWDLVIVDEAHKMSAYKSGNSRKATSRYALGEMLASHTNHLLLMTATPHRGDPHNFAYLLQLVDPDLFSTKRGSELAGNEQEPSENQFSHSRLAELAKTVLLRRLKEDLKDFEGRRLYPERTVETVRYNLSPEEKDLYDAVTSYVQNGLSSLNSHSRQDRNTGLALITLQRRVASSLAAILRSLDRRLGKLRDALNTVGIRPTSTDYTEGYNSSTDWLDEDDDEDELEENRWRREQDREGATSARTREQLEREILQVEELVRLGKLADAAGNETKLGAIRNILGNSDRPVVGGDEKLLIFTEHKDTLDYLVKKLQSLGLDVTAIHGGMKRSDREAAQEDFKTKCQVMVATEAAGEGINLQFCRLMINYDIPWNPNRLEQRMGRIHRYLQKRPVYIYNMVAANTREGDVVARLLDKLEAMRHDLGSDKVYDVISTLLEGMQLDLKKLILDAIADDAKKNEALSVIDETFKTQAREKLKQATEEVLATSLVNTEALAEEKERSRLSRIVPEASERFFQGACKALGMRLEKRTDGFWRVPNVPAYLRNFAAERGLERPQEDYKKFTFFKYQRTDDDTLLMTPMHPLFAAVVEQVREKFGKLLQQGTILHEPGSQESSALWFFRGRVTDGRNLVVGEKLFAVRTPISLTISDYENHLVELSYNPSTLVDLTSPPNSPVAPPPQTPSLLEMENVALDAVLTEQLLPYSQILEQQRTRNASVMRRYIERSFDSLISQENRTILQQKVRQRQGEDMKIAISTTQSRLDRHIEQKQRRLTDLEREVSLNMEAPELIGVAICQPVAVSPDLAGAMHNDPLVEKAAVDFVKAYEAQFGREAVSFEKDNVGYDLESNGEGQLTRYIEVKGRAGEGLVALTPNEWDTARRLGQDYWLYIVTYAKTTPKLRAIQNPANQLTAIEEVTVTRYLVPVEEYKRAAIEEKL